MAEEGVVENAAHVGRDSISPALSALAAKHEIVGEVRGRGVF